MSIVSFAWPALHHTPGMARYIESPASGYYMDKDYGSYCPQLFEVATSARHDVTYRFGQNIRHTVCTALHLGLNLDTN